METMQLKKAAPQKAAILYLGIDPGSASGAYAIINHNEQVIKADIFTDFAVIKRTLNLFKQNIEIACIEKVSARPGQGVSSSFKFGGNYYSWQTALTILDIPFELISPIKWQKAVLDYIPAKLVRDDYEGENEAKRRTYQNTKILKEAIVQYVKRTVPSVSDALNAKKNWGIADAVCLALYAKRKRQGQLSG